jgi:prolipoprotein diacylglyceryltransferase
MSWDLYLTLKVGGIAVFVFAGGLAVTKNLPLSRAQAYFFNAVAVAAGFTASRLWYILQHLWGREEYEYRSILQIGEAWDLAGAVLYGWVLGGTLALFWLTRMFKIPTVKYLDCVLPWLLVAQFLNRLGCWDAGCCFSKEGLPPVQALEAFFDLALFWFIRTRPKRTGLPTFLYFTGYPAARFVFEFLRGDNQPAFLFMTVPQVTSVLILAFVLVNRKKIVL